MSRPPLKVDWSSALDGLYRLAAFEPAAVRDFIKKFEKVAAFGFNVGRPAESELAGFRYVIGNLQALYDKDPPYLRVVLVEDARRQDAHS